MISVEAKLARFDNFWLQSEAQFLHRADELYGPLAPRQVDFARAAFLKAKADVDARWHLIRDAETDMEDNIRKAYRVKERVYSSVIELVPKPSISLAMRPY